MRSKARTTTCLVLILLASTASGCSFFNALTRGPGAPIEGLSVCPTLNLYPLPELEKVTLVRRVHDGYVISEEMWDTSLDNIAKVIQNNRKHRTQIQIYGIEYPISGMTSGTARR